MAGLVERLGSMAGTEAGKAINLAHETYQTRMGAHNHVGRALLETVATVARAHPNLMGIAAGLLVEQILVEERRHHEAAVEAGLAEPHDMPRIPHPHLPHVDLPHVNAPHLHAPHIPTDALRIGNIRPGKVALEVFGALVLLKLATAGAHIFRRKNKPDVWFAPAARIHLLSGTLAAYYLAKSLRSPKVSSWRNAAVALFATDALKPVLKAPKVKKGRAAPAGLAPSRPIQVSPAPLPPINPPTPPVSGPPAAPTSTRDDAASPPVPPSGNANEPPPAPSSAVAAAPQFWTPPAPPARTGPAGEIIQWTGFSGGGGSASNRLID